MKKENVKKTAAEKGKKNTDTLSSFKLSNEQKVWLGIASIILMILIVVLVIFFLNNVIFEENAHFTISTVKIDTQGKTTSYWNDPRTVDARSAELAREMEIEPGKDNLFAQDLAEKRKDLLKGHPEMEDIQLIPILPDILQIRIAERLPVARLDRDMTENARVIDKKLCVFSAKYYGYAKSLPFIQDETCSDEEKNQLVAGNQVKSDGIKFLLDFIQLLETNEFQFQVVSAIIVEDNSKDNYGKCIKAHLKRNGFECSAIFIPYPDGPVELLKENCKVLRSYAEENAIVIKGQLSVSGNNVTKR